MTESEPDTEATELFDRCWFNFGLLKLFKFESDYFNELRFYTLSSLSDITVVSSSSDVWFIALLEGFLPTFAKLLKVLPLIEILGFIFYWFVGLNFTSTGALPSGEGESPSFLTSLIWFAGITILFPIYSNL